jgi:hypothetical protein
MATSENTAAPQQQPIDNQPQGKICYGDCFRCSYQQAWMCASMHARRAMRTTEELMEAIGILTQTVTELKAQVSDLQAKFDKAELINPLEETEEVEDDQEETEDIHLWPETEGNEDLPGWATGTVKPLGQSATDGMKTAKRKR